MAKQPVAEYYKGMPKGEREARAFFHEQALALMQQVFGLEPVEREEARGALLGPCVTFTAMTDAGRLNIRVGDDEITTDFELPAEAARSVPCNPYSGKWNHHAFVSRSTHGKEAEARWKGNYLAGVIHGVYLDMERMNARPWVETPASITVAEALAIGEPELKRRTAMGEVFTITNWDRSGDLRHYLDTVTDVNGGRPDWLVQSNTRWVEMKTDVEAFFGYRRWKARMDGQAAGSSGFATTNQRGQSCPRSA